jgi:hypothetical protein
LDSNIPYTTGTDQYHWLVDELTCNPYQWVFVFFHHPPWTNAWSADYYLPFSEYFLYQGNEDMRTDLVPLFEDYDVDFVLNGHSHCYQRGELNDVKYIISGGAGSALMDFNTNSNSPNIDTEIYSNQYVRFEMNGDTATYYSIDDNDNIIDEVTTIKPFTVYPPPTITYLGGELWSSPGDSYTWFLDGIEMMGVTTQSFIPTQLGEYTVQITTMNGCAYLSAPFVLSDTGIDEMEGNTIIIFPNPSSGLITLRTSGTFLNNVNVRIINAMGQTVHMETLTGENDQQKIDLSSLDVGMYYLIIETENGQITKRIVRK